MSIAKQIAKNKRMSADEYQAIVMQLLKSIYGMDMVLRDMAKGEVTPEELEKVHASVGILLDNFGVEVKEAPIEDANS